MPDLALDLAVGPGFPGYGGVSALVYGGPNVNGVSPLVARADHIHALPALPGNDAYYGVSPSALAWSSAVWTGFHAVPAVITDVVAANITRNNSDFTFVAAGFYEWHSTANFANAAGATRGLGFRLRDVAGGTNKIQGVNAANASQLCATELKGYFQTTAGQVLQLQYCTAAGSTGSFGALTLDGLALNNMQIVCLRVG